MTEVLASCTTQGMGETYVLTITKINFIWFCTFYSRLRLVNCHNQIINSLYFKISTSHKSWGSIYSPFCGFYFYFSGILLVFQSKKIIFYISYARKHPPIHWARYGVDTMYV
jgi:hypothetical protein